MRKISLTSFAVSHFVLVDKYLLIYKSGEAPIIQMYPKTRYGYHVIKMFLRLIGYHISLGIGFRWLASRTRGPL